MLYDYESNSMALFCQPSSGNFYKKSVLKLLKSYGLEEQENIFEDSSDGNLIIIEPKTVYMVQRRNMFDEDPLHIPKHTNILLEYLRHNLILEPERASQLYCVREFKVGKVHITPGERAGLFSIPSSGPSNNQIMKIGPDPRANYNMKEDETIPLAGIHRNENEYFTDNINRANRILRYENNSEQCF